MSSTTGPSSPTSVTSSVITSTHHCSTTFSSMVSSNSISGGDDEPCSAFINGGSPPINTDLSLRVIAHTPSTAVMTIRSPLYPVDDEEDDPNVKSSRSTPRDDCPRQSRNKRKNFKPRNIVYHYNADDEYTTEEDCYESQTEFASPRSPSAPVASRIFERGGEQPLDLSSDTGPPRWKTEPKSEDSPRYDQCRYDEEDDDLEEERGRTPVMDLSRNSARDGSSSSPSHSKNNDYSVSPQMICRLNYPSVKRHSLMTPEGATMKDYAENTMKELLGMYGLNDATDHHFHEFQGASNGHLSGKTHVLLKRKEKKTFH